MNRDRSGQGSIGAETAILLISVAEPPGQALSDRLQLAEIAWTAGPRDVWLSRGRFPALSLVLAEAVSTGQVWSAVLVREPPGTDRRWIAVEWQGMLVIDRMLRELVPSVDWVDHDVNGDLVVLRPTPSAGEVRQPTQTVEGAAEFRGALYGPPVSVDVPVEEVLAHLGGWFGELADERVGGAFALLAMSGAGSRPTVRLRNPAALGLLMDDNPESLASYRKAGRIRAVAFGLTRYALNSAADVARNFPLESEQQELQRELDRRPPVDADYVVVLELSATADPAVLIPHGAVFEQESLTGAQTLAAAEARTAEVDVSAFVPVVLSAWCLDSNLRAPAGQPVRPTPLVFPISGDQTQPGIWDQRNKLVGGHR